MSVNLSSMRTLHIIFVSCLVGLLLKFAMAEGNQRESNQEGFHFEIYMKSSLVNDFVKGVQILHNLNVMYVCMKIILL
jgi:hypothetical protein